MTKLASFLAGAVLAMSSATASAWTIHADFDDGDIGAKADLGGDGFHGAGGRSTYSEDQRLKTNSARIEIKEGETGYGKWGGVFPFPEKAYKGETIWFLVHTYMPEGFDHYSYGQGGRLKFLRIHTASASGENHGYNDLYFDQKEAGQPFKWIYEGQNLWVDIGDSTHYPVKDRWESYEMAVTLDDVPVSEGGTAAVRIWKNGALLKEITDRKTLKTADSYSSRALLFTYWNGGSPKDQHMYVDEITVTNERPENTDAHGNPYVGGLLQNRPAMQGN